MLVNVNVGGGLTLHHLHIILLTQNHSVLLINI